MEALLTTGSESEKYPIFYNPLIQKIHINDKARCASTPAGIRKRSKDQKIIRKKKPIKTETPYQSPMHPSF